MYNQPSNESMTARAPFILPAQLEGDFTAEELSEDMEGVTLRLPRAKIPGGGTIQFELTGDNPDEPEYSKSIEGVLMYTHLANAYWPEGEEYDDDAPPLCQSVDGKTGYHVIPAVDGLMGLRLAEERYPALVIADVTKADPKTVDVCRGLTEAGIQAPILLLASDEQAEETTKMVMNVEYIKKPFRMQALLMRVRLNMPGFEDSDETIVSDCLVVGNITIDKGRALVTKNGIPLELSKRETDLLLYLADKAGTTITREELLTQVWEYSYLGDLHHVDVVVHRLREKLEDDPTNPTLIVTRRGSGYVFFRDSVMKNQNRQ